MRRQLTVSWSEQQSYQIDLDGDALPADQGRRWLDQQFTEFDCVPLRPTGKVLTADKALALADAVGPAHFSEAAHREWAQAYAGAVLSALERPLAHVNLARLTVG
jgi:hypothetical protein